MSGLRVAATLNRTRYATFEQLGYRADGAETMPRFAPTNSTLGLASGVVRFAYFTARRTETVTQISINTGATAAGATPTLIRYGLYSVAANGDLTQIAATENDTSLLATTQASHPKALAAPVELTGGARYAVAAIVVTSAAAATVFSSFCVAAADNGAEPRLAASRTGQTDLLASYTAAQLTLTQHIFYASIRP